jgi:hypothetical protein
VTTSAPAQAGQVGVTVGIEGAGTVRVVEGYLPDITVMTCNREDNQDHRVRVSCPRFRSTAAFEAWVWLRATPAPSPEGQWRFDGWSGCDATRVKDGHTECAVHSGAFSSDERHPVARFRDTVAPTISGLQVAQVADVDRQFRLSYTASDGVTECRFGSAAPWVACGTVETLTLPEGPHSIDVRATDPSGNVGAADVQLVSVDTLLVSRPSPYANYTWAWFEALTRGGKEFWCSLDHAAWTKCADGGYLSHDVTDLPDGLHTFRIQARAGGWADPVPVVWQWTVDTAAPTSVLTASTSGRTATFRFTSEGGHRFECKLDRPGMAGTWDYCDGPQHYADLEEGPHAFSVLARDRAGNIEAEPQVHRWTVDTLAPTTSLTASTTTDKATFVFGAEGATRVECRLTTPSGAGTWAPCTSPVTYTGLTPGQHRFEVRSTDDAGNVETAPASHEWTATSPVVGPVPPPGTTPPPGTPPPATGRATSATRAAWKVSAARKGKVTVTVSSSVVPTGAVVVKDRGRVIAKATLKAADRGRIVLVLPRLRRGKHVLVASYGGSAATATSSAPKRTVTLR